VLITLQDSGTGIDPAHMDRIFDAFFTTKDRGMGMGLSICRSIVESHGGQLWASPNNPHGTSFYVKVPSAAANEIPDSYLRALDRFECRQRPVRACIWSQRK
jgi:signal transduction histidine kinase